MRKLLQKKTWPTVSGVSAELAPNRAVFCSNWVLSSLGAYPLEWFLPRPSEFWAALTTHSSNMVAPSLPLGSLLPFVDGVSTMAVMVVLR
jgi:hypothetical protein